MITYAPEVLETLIQGQNAFVWETTPFARYERGKGWYLFMTITAVFLVAYAIKTGNFLFAFLILLCAMVLILAGNEDPKTVLVQIGENGVVWDGKLYLYQDISEFSLIYQPPRSKVLYLEPKSSLHPRIRILLEEQNPVEIRDYIKRFIKENTDLQTEHFSDSLGRLLKI